MLKGAMQQGKTRPLAVMYISDHGRRQSDQGLSERCILMDSPGSTAPEAENMTPSCFAIDSASRMSASSRSVVCSKRADSARARESLLMGSSKKTRRGKLASVTPDERSEGEEFGRRVDSLGEAVKPEVNGRFGRFGSARKAVKIFSVAHNLVKEFLPRTIWKT